MKETKSAINAKIELQKQEANRILNLFDNNIIHAQTMVHELIRKLDNYDKINYYINVLSHL